RGELEGKAEPSIDGVRVRGRRRARTDQRLRAARVDLLAGLRVLALPLARLERRVETFGPQVGLELLGRQLDRSRPVAVAEHEDPAAPEPKRAGVHVPVEACDRLLPAVRAGRGEPQDAVRLRHDRLPDEALPDAEVDRDRRAGGGPELR